MTTELRTKIVAAFPEQPIPNPETAVFDMYSAEDVQDRLLGHRWTEPSVDDYRLSEEGLWVLTVPGLHYYLPGYLVAELDDPETADIIAGSVCYAVGGRAAECRKRMQHLGKLMTAVQQSALRHWLEHYIDSYGYDGCTRRAIATVESWE